MTENRREREMLEELFAEAHRPTREGTPEFARLWSRAAARVEPARAGRRARLAAAAMGAAALALSVVIGLWAFERRSRAELDRAMAIATQVSEWRAPLDFLLETPGQEWLETTPSWDPESTPGTWDFATDSLPEVPQ